MPENDANGKPVEPSPEELYAQELTNVATAQLLQSQKAIQGITPAIEEFQKHLPKPQDTPYILDRMHPEQARVTGELIKGAQPLSLNAETVEELRDHNKMEQIKKNLNDYRDQHAIDAMISKVREAARVNELWHNPQMKTSALSPEGELSEDLLAKNLTEFQANFSRYKKDGTVRENLIRLWTHPNLDKSYVDLIGWQIERSIQRNVFENDSELQSMLAEMNSIRTGKVLPNMVSDSALGEERKILEKNLQDFAEGQRNSKYIDQIVAKHFKKTIATEASEIQWVAQKAASLVGADAEYFQQMRETDEKVTELVAGWGKESFNIFVNWISNGEKGDPKDIEIIQDLKKKFGPKWKSTLGYWTLREAALMAASVATVKGMGGGSGSAIWAGTQPALAKAITLSMEAMVYEAYKMSASTVRDALSSDPKIEQMYWETSRNLALAGIFGGALSLGFTGMRVAGKKIPELMRHVMDMVTTKADDVVWREMDKWGRPMLMTPAENLAETAADPAVSKSMALEAFNANFGKETSIPGLAVDRPNIGPFSGLFKLLGEIGHDETILKEWSDQLVGLTQSNEIAATKLMMDAAYAKSGTHATLMAVPLGNGNFRLRFPQIEEDVLFAPLSSAQKLASKTDKQALKDLGSIGIVGKIRKAVGILSPSEGSTVEHEMIRDMDDITRLWETDARNLSKEISTIFKDIKRDLPARGALRERRFNTALQAMNEANQWFPPEELVRRFKWDAEMLGTFYTRYIPFVKEMYYRNNSQAVTNVMSAGKELYKWSSAGLDGKGQLAIANRLFPANIKLDLSTSEASEKTIQTLMANKEFAAFVKRVEDASGITAADPGHPIYEMLYNGKVPIWGQDAAAKWGVLSRGDEYIQMVDPGELVKPSATKPAMSQTGTGGPVATIPVPIKDLPRVLPELDGYFPRADGETLSGRHFLFEIDPTVIGTEIKTLGERAYDPVAAKRPTSDTERARRGIQAKFVHPHKASAISTMKRLQAENPSKQYTIISTGSAGQISIDQPRNFLNGQVTEESLAMVLRAIEETGAVKAADLDTIRDVISKASITPSMQHRSEEVLQTTNLLGQPRAQKLLPPEAAWLEGIRLSTRTHGHVNMREGFMQSYVSTFKEFLPSGRWDGPLVLPDGSTPLQVTKFEIAGRARKIMNDTLFNQLTPGEAAVESWLNQQSMKAASFGDYDNWATTAFANVLEETGRTRRNINALKTVTGMRFFVGNISTGLQQLIVLNNQAISRLASTRPADLVGWLTDTTSLALTYAPGMDKFVPMVSSRISALRKEIDASGYIADIDGIGDWGAEDVMQNIRKPAFTTVRVGETLARLFSFKAARQDLQNRVGAPFGRNAVGEEVANPEFFKYFKVDPKTGQYTLTQSGLSSVVERAKAYNLNLHKADAVDASRGFTGLVTQLWLNPAVKVGEQMFSSNKFTRGERLRFIVGNMATFGYGSILGGVSAAHGLATLMDTFREKQRSGLYRGSPRTAEEDLKMYTRIFSEYLAAGEIEVKTAYNSMLPNDETYTSKDARGRTTRHIVDHPIDQQTFGVEVPNKDKTTDKYYKFLRKGIIGDMVQGDSDMEFQMTERLFMGSLLVDIYEKWGDNFLNIIPTVSANTRGREGVMGALDTLTIALGKSDTGGAASEFLKALSEGDEARLDEMHAQKAFVQSLRGLPGIQKLVLTAYASGLGADKERVFLDNHGDEIRTNKDVGLGDYLMRIYGYGPSVAEEIRRLNDVTVKEKEWIFDEALVTARRFQLNPEEGTAYLQKTIETLKAANKPALTGLYVTRYAMLFVDKRLAEEVNLTRKMIDSLERSGNIDILHGLY